MFKLAGLEFRRPGHADVIRILPSGGHHLGIVDPAIMINEQRRLFGPYRFLILAPKAPGAVVRLTQAVIS